MAATVFAGCSAAPPPQIASVAPAPSQGAVHTDVPIVITFTEAMNERSVDVRFRLRNRKGRRAPGCDVTRAARGESTGCHFHWPNPKEMELLHPYHPLAVVTTYRVQLLGGFRSTSGEVNSLSHSWEFSTEGGPLVSSTVPTSGGAVGPDQALTINFSRDMRLASLRDAVHLTPSPAGGYTLEPNLTIPGRFLVEPAHPLVPGQKYVLSISRRAEDLDGDHLPKAVTVHFTAGPLGSSTAVDFAAGSSEAAPTEVVAASPPLVAGDPPNLRILTTAPAGQHYAHAWPSPDGSRLATTLAGSNPIEILSLATGKEVSVLGSDGSSAAAWSPSGQQLAFVVQGALRVYTISSGTSVTLSSSNGETISGPLSWNPDGDVIAAVAQPTGGTPRIALLSPGLRALTYLPTPAADVQPQGNPVWGTDGTSLAFTIGSGQKTAVWLYRPADSSAPVSQLTSLNAVPLAYLSSAQILAQARNGELLSLSTTTGTATDLVGGFQGSAPLKATSSVTAREIAFTQLRHGYVQLLLSNDDGSGVVDLTQFSASNGLFAGPPTFTGSAS